MPGNAKPPRAPVRPPARVSGVGDAIDVLESRRRPAQPGKAQPRRRRGDLDLDAIP